MNYFKTINEARAHAKKNHVQNVIKFNHVTAGEVFMAAKCNMSFFAFALKKNPMAEIVNLISDHKIETEEEIKAIKAKLKAEYKASNQCWYDDHTKNMHNALVNGVAK